MKSFENMKYPKFKPAIRAGMNDFPAKKQKKVSYEKNTHCIKPLTTEY